MFDPQIFISQYSEKVVRHAMAETGFYMFETRLSPDTCAQLRARIDRLSEEQDVEINYAGSEHRVWHAAERDEAFAPFEQLSNWLLPKLYGRASPAHNVLAIRNRPVPPEAERAKVRWHIDSFRMQLKLFAFLTDVGEDNGPLEYLPGTHRRYFKWRNAIPLGYYGVSDLNPAKYFDPVRRKKRRWQRIHDDTVAKVESGGFDVVPFTVPAGTLAVVDTSALHRAKPCLRGERYAVTVYHR